MSAQVPTLTVPLTPPAPAVPVLPGFTAPPAAPPAPRVSASSPSSERCPPLILLLRRLWRVRTASVHRTYMTPASQVQLRVWAAAGELHLRTGEPLRFFQLSSVWISFSPSHVVALFSHPAPSLLFYLTCFTSVLNPAPSQHTPYFQRSDKTWTLTCPPVVAVTSSGVPQVTGACSFGVSVTQHSSLKPSSQ